MLRGLSILVLLSSLLSGCAGGPNASQLSQKAADSPESVYSERIDADHYLLAMATQIRADRPASEAKFETTRVSMHQEAVKLAREAGSSGYVLIDERIFEKVRIRRVLDATAREPQAFVREWKIGIGDASKPRDDGRSWISAR